MPYWRPYVPVAERRAKAKRKMAALAKKGKKVQPVEIEGRAIARSFWGKGWCDHLEGFSDYSNRLPRGRTYVRNGSVVHLEILPGRVEAKVVGSELYDIVIDIAPLKNALWKRIKKKTAGQIGSVLELLQGALSDEVMRIVTDRKDGLFPKSREITLNCSCPDWAVMCKHVSAVLYGVGNRLDLQPELLFVLRGVDAKELIDAKLALSTRAKPNKNALRDDQLGSIFGVDIDLSEEAPALPGKAKPKRGAKTSVKTKAKAKAKTKADTRTKTKGRKSGARTQPMPVAVDAPFQPSGADIAGHRKKMGLSAAEFATHLGLSVATVYRWERVDGPVSIRKGIREKLQRDFEGNN